MEKRILMVAGEASGDLHGAALARELFRLHPGLVLEGIGGERMQEAGVQLKHYASGLSVVGGWEVVGRLRTLAQAFVRVRKILLQERPDLCILIDHPDFNLLVARVAKRAGIPVVYFIGPQVWAWRRGRIKTLKRLVKKMLLIFPFEEELYREAGLDASFVGHPLLDRLGAVVGREEATRILELDGKGVVIGLLPGSRIEELRRHLPVMLRAGERIFASLSNVQLVVALADALPLEEAKAILQDTKLPVKLMKGMTYEVMQASDLLIVASGTATLEATLLGVPMIIIYRLSPPSYILGRLLVRVPYVGMANLVAGKKVVPELLQGEANPGRIAALALELLASPERLRGIRAELEGVKAKLGAPGASTRAAHEVLRVLRS